MEDLNLLISKKGTELLTSLIGQEFISMEHAKLKGRDIVFEKIEIASSNGRYLIDNRVDWFDDYFSGPEDMPFLDFKELNNDDDPFKTWSNDSTETQTIKEKIVNVVIVQDDCDVYKGDVFCQHIKSSEGIIIVTEKSQYSFFKDNMWLDEHVVIAKDENNVLSKAESLKEHYDIFGYPFNGKCQRSVISLKEGTIKVVETAEEVGEVAEEDQAAVQ